VKQNIAQIFYSLKAPRSLSIQHNTPDTVSPVLGMNVLPPVTVTSELSRAKRLTSLPKKKAFYCYEMLVHFYLAM
jgi:hypothetical protein